MSLTIARLLSTSAHLCLVFQLPVSLLVSDCFSHRSRDVIADEPALFPSSFPANFAPKVFRITRRESKVGIAIGAYVLASYALVVNLEHKFKALGAPALLASFLLNFRRCADV